jgi:hypothetical protein
LSAADWSLVRHHPELVRGPKYLLLDRVFSAHRRAADP